MDELIISGKRYISTKRAGKEYRYHSDYIGQLVRSGKVQGQKVGRSWYVSETSLAAYLRSEASEYRPQRTQHSAPPKKDVSSVHEAPVYEPMIHTESANAQQPTSHVSKEHAHTSTKEKEEGEDTEPKLLTYIPEHPHDNHATSGNEPVPLHKATQSIPAQQAAAVHHAEPEVPPIRTNTEVQLTANPTPEIEDEKPISLHIAPDSGTRNVYSGPDFAAHYSLTEPVESIHDYRLSGDSLGVLPILIAGSLSLLATVAVSLLLTLGGQTVTF
jgi:hypothetical protein